VLREKGFGAKKNAIAMLLFMAMLLLTLGGGALAEEIDVSRETELSVSYVVAGTPIPGASFRLYRVADVDERGVFSLTGQFTDTPVRLDDLSSEGLRNLAQTLLGYVDVNGYAPDATATTDASGKLRFARQRTGLYLIAGETINYNGRSYSPGAAMIPLPTWEENGGYYSYVVTVLPKSDNHPITEVRAVKRWEDAGAQALRPAEITVRLLQNGRVYDTQTLSAATNWEYTWENLDGTHSWNVVEYPEPGDYDVTVSVDGGVYTITNRYNPAPTPIPSIQLAGEKQWDDNENEMLARPEAIELVLYANGEPTDIQPTWGDTTTSVWPYVYSNLPSMDEDGNAIAYTVTELPVPYYETTIDGTTIINRLIPQTTQEYIDITGTKSWMNDSPDQRPESVTVLLLQNGAVFDQRVVTEADGWAYSFTHVPKDDGYGHDYIYEISEQMVSGYYMMTDGYNLINVRVPDNPPGRSRTPEGGDDQPPREPTPPPFDRFPEEGLEELIDLFDYDVPLWGGLLGTGFELPAYPFVFGGIGLAAIILLIVFGRKKKKEQ